MLQALTALLLFQLAGEALVQFFVLPIPGPVIGLALLFAAMSLRPAIADRLRESAAALLQHLSLLFVPAGVGVMLHARLGDDVAQGQPLMTVHAEAEGELAYALEFAAANPDIVQLEA